MGGGCLSDLLLNCPKISSKALRHSLEKILSLFLLFISVKLIFFVFFSWDSSSYQACIAGSQIGHFIFVRCRTLIFLSRGNAFPLRGPLSENALLTQDSFCWLLSVCQKDKISPASVCTNALRLPSIIFYLLLLSGFSTTCGREEENEHVYNVMFCVSMYCQS